MHWEADPEPMDSTVHEGNHQRNSNVGTMRPLRWPEGLENMKKYAQLRPPTWRAARTNQRPQRSL